MRSDFTKVRRPTTLAYLAGLLEGEGAFLAPPPSSPNQAAVVLSMTDHDVVARAAELVEAYTCWLGSARQPHHKPALTWRIRGLRAVELMTALRERLSPRRRAQIDAALARRDVRAKRKPYATEVAEMVVLKAAGVHRAELGARYGVAPLSVNAILRGDFRPLDAVLARASRISRIEAEIASAVDNSEEWAWLAGLLEGEGGFGADTVTLEMTDEVVVRRAAALMGGQVAYRAPRKAGWSGVWTTSIGATKAAKIGGHIARALGERRHQQLSQVVTHQRRPAVAKRGRQSKRGGYVASAKIERNLEIARRLAAGERGPAIAAEYGMTHQNVYHIRKVYGPRLAGPNG